jgi:hypothetical protein
MRIKKKHVLMEAMLVDVSTEFTQTEKNILKVIYKKYGHDVYGSESEFNQWEVAAWLIETLEIPYEQAYGLTKTYFYNHRELFSDLKQYRKHIPLPSIFFDYFDKLNVKFVDTITDEDGKYKEVLVNFDGDAGFEDIRDVVVWKSYKGIVLYVSFDRWNPIGGTYISTDQGFSRLLRFKITYTPIGINGVELPTYLIDEDWEKDVDDTKFLVTVTYRIGDGESKSGELPFMSFEVPYPDKITPQSFSDTNKKIVDDVIEKISKTTFKLPEGVTPINVSNQPD